MKFAEGMNIFGEENTTGKYYWVNTKGQNEFVHNNMKTRPFFAFYLQTIIYILMIM